MEETVLLWNLQEIEQEWEKIKALQKKTNLNNNSLKLQRDLAGLENSIQIQQEELMENRKILKAADLELQGLAIERKEIESKLYSGELTQTKELEIWQGKLNTLGSAVQNKEEIVVGLMEAIEGKEQSLEGQYALLEGKQKIWEEQVEKSKALEEKIKKRLAFLQQKRKKILACLSKELADRYENGKKRFGLGVVAKLKGCVCQGCRMALPTGIVQRISGSPGLHTCENCGRILYISQNEE